MWQPDPAWEPLQGGRGTLTVGLWRVEGPPSLLVKRVAAPGPEDPAELLRPEHPAYWRRELEVARAGWRGAGLLPPEVVEATEDPEGYTVTTVEVEHRTVSALFAARALARLAAAPAPSAPWLGRRLLRERLRRAEPRGGWPTLARTPVADLADLLWRRRGALLERYDALPQALAHGDAVPGNLIAPAEESEDSAAVVAVDWGALGLAPAGADLGYFTLSCREDFEVLLSVFTAELRASGVQADPSDVAFAARAMAVYTVVSQAEWALARVAGGEGALAAKFRHPSVARYLRALQRQLPQLEALLQA